MSALVCVAAVIVDDDGRLFVQRRSADRRLFPLAWDIVGGHVEPGETLQEALRREVYEETGWRLAHIAARLPPLSWRGDDGLDRVEYDFIVDVDGDLGAPRLEAGKHTEYRWVPPAELDILLEHRTVDADLLAWIANLRGVLVDRCRPG